MAGIYIHIPFCASRCVYCGFYSTVRLNERQAYVDAVCREMELRGPYVAVSPQPVETLYLGGGTPSQLSGNQLSQLFHHIYKVYGTDLSTLKEVTIECNPDDITVEYAATLSQFPITRVSMGAQTFDDARLRFLRRRHHADDVRTAVSRLRHAGIGNISIDLMFGFHGETLADWQRDIDAALGLGVEHISAYSLMVEEGTALQRMVDAGTCHPIDEEGAAAMYDTLIDRLTAAGYEHYEISNFARPSFRSRHNSNYWNATPYIGLGAAAHSYDGQSRQWNVSDIDRYIASITSGVVPCEREVLDDDTRYNDLITTALRTREGIHLPSLEKKYRDYLLENARQSLRNGHLAIDGNYIHLTRSGLFISDSVMSDLIYILPSSPR